MTTLQFNNIFSKLGGGGVQGQGEGQRLMSNIAVNDYIWWATCQGRIFEKYPPLAARLQYVVLLVTDISSEKPRSYIFQP